MSFNCIIYYRYNFTELHSKKIIVSIALIESFKFKFQILGFNMLNREIVKHIFTFYM